MAAHRPHLWAGDMQTDRHGERRVGRRRESCPGGVENRLLLTRTGGGGSPVHGWVGQPTALALRQEWEGGREGRGGRQASGLGHSNKGEEREGEERRWRQQRGERWGEGRMGTAPCPV